MIEAHRLYRTVGFREIEAYEGSEIPKEFQKHWIFMEIRLSGNTALSIKNSQILAEIDIYQKNLGGE